MHGGDRWVVADLLGDELGRGFGLVIGPRGEEEFA